MYAVHMHVHVLYTNLMLYRFCNLIQETFLFKVLPRIMDKSYAYYRKLKIGWQLAMVLLQQWHLSRYSGLYFRWTVLLITLLKSFLLILSHTSKQLLSHWSIFIPKTIYYLLSWVLLSVDCVWMFNKDLMNQFCLIYCNFRAKTAFNH